MSHRNVLLAFYVQLDYWFKFVFFLSKRIFSPKPHFIMLILTFSLSSLIWSSVYYFQYKCTVSTAGVCDATAFAANEATIRLRTMICSCKHWLSPNEGIDGIWYIWYSKLSKWISQPIVSSSLWQLWSPKDEYSPSIQ